MLLNSLKKSATEKPSSRTRPELGAKFRNRAGFCIFFRPPTERGRVLFSAQIRNTAMAAKFDRYVEEFLLFCFSVDFQTHNKLICIKNWLQKKNDIVVWRLRDWFPGRQVVPTVYPNYHLGHVIDHSYSILPKLKKCYRYLQSSFWYCCWDLNYLNKSRKNWQRVTLLFSSVQEADDESTMLPIFRLN